MTVRFTRPALPVFVGLIVVLAAGAIGMQVAMRSLELYLRKEPVPLRADLGSIPATLGRWQRIGEDQTLDAAMVESLGTEQYLTRNYALDGDAAKGVLVLHIAYYTGMIDTVPHIPERCWGANGLVQCGDPQAIQLTVPVLAAVPADAPRNVATGQPYPMATIADPVTGVEERVALPPGDCAMTVTAFQNPQAARVQQLGGYMFIANGRCTPSTLGVRSMAFNLSDRYAYYCKLQLSAQYPAGDTPAYGAFRAQAEDFLTHLLPQLMRRLPDWPSVERRGAAPHGT